MSEPASGLLRGKICMVTGATGALGTAVAALFAMQSARVILVGRDRSRCQAALEAVKQQTGNTALEVMLADFSSLTAVRRLARQYESRYERLHALVHCVGAWFPEHEVTPDGLEATLAVNFLSQFLLTTALIDTLKASAPARIVGIACDAYRQGRFDWDEDEPQDRYSPELAYAQSKLATVTLAAALAARLEGTGVAANAIDPGPLDTPLRRSTSGNLTRMLGSGGTPAGVAAKWILNLVAAPTSEIPSGQFMVKDRPARPTEEAANAAVGERLWNKSLEITGLRSARRHETRPPEGA